MHKLESLGICLGASSVSFVRVSSSNEGIKVIFSESVPHNGNPKTILEERLAGPLPERIAVTGRKFRKLCNLSSISEAEAIEHSLEFESSSPDIVISAGGENFIVYALDENKRINKVLTGNKCASGTGEFFLQQLKRMNVGLNEAVKCGEEGHPYNISGRCSVFCKSDCTHALNKGVAKSDVIAGLCRMMAQKILELTSRIKYENALLIGGVSKNRGMIRFLNENPKQITIPRHADCYEALGAALFALKNETVKLNRDRLFKEEHSNFTFHEPLKNYIGKVDFKSVTRSSAVKDDECILGLDVGSTTTKAVLLRIKDNAILASEYLRTNGEPVNASIECYKSIDKQTGAPVKITGLGVTGSGRHIAGLHAMTDGVINEIIAHAAATVYFDKDVDTIFEIGGQDAKYTHITSGIASDYAMNEACSAGTGSFLEEAAKESLGIDFTDIGDIALKSDRPPNFNDQCSAFISSDIKNALHEGLSKEDIVAGLVYSICLNYTNRVKGNRPIGRKVFMQGGVCYNKAVPVAMAALTGKEIIVPPEPGLMGAFGVALEIKKRLRLNLLTAGNFNLKTLINRTFEYDKEFICAGGKEKCDRKCPVAVVKIEGKKIPFGGACNKYYNNLPAESDNETTQNYVALRQKLVFEKYAPPKPVSLNSQTVGISKSFLTNTLYPLFYNFFTGLGLNVVLGDTPKTSGIEKKEAPFCYPVELAHGFFQDLLDKKPDYIFIPHITEIEVPGESFYKKTCVLLQSESYYLKSAFKNEIGPIKLISPVLDFSSGYSSAEKEFIEIALQMGRGKKEAVKSYREACRMLYAMLEEFRQIGTGALNKLKEDSSGFGIVLFGRAYNAFTKEANLGIPQKFTSRGVTIIPHDFLPCDEEKSYSHMYWGTGHQIIKAARFVKDNERLYAAYITNFSCGPDSFLIGYFRNIMGQKPSLTLELDSHSADAGINTRIEAALDIIRSYRELKKIQPETPKPVNGFMPLRVKDSYTLIDSDGNELSIKDKNVKMLIPSMGGIATEAFAAAFRHAGINSEPLPLYENSTLITGRGNTACKECLPLILGTGSFLEYCEKRNNPGEISLYFMPKGDGPCRLGQYHVLQNDVIKKRKLRNFGVYSMSDDDSYGGLGNEFNLRGWTAITISDVAKDVYNSILAIAKNRDEGKKLFRSGWAGIISSIERDDTNEVIKKLENFALSLSEIELNEPYAAAKKILLTGEIFVRHDEFSRIDLIERLSEKGFIVRTAPIGEYVYYSNYLAKINNPQVSSNPVERFKFTLREYFQKNIEKRIKKALSKSGLVDYSLIKIKEIIGHSENLVRKEMEGEAILTIGSALKEIRESVCGVISIGPFGCMPSRVAESILNVEMGNGDNPLPFLAIETDGNIYPQILQSRIEIFMLQAERRHRTLLAHSADFKTEELNDVSRQSGKKFHTPGKSGRKNPEYDNALLEQ